VKDSRVIEVGPGDDPDVAASHGVAAPYQTADYLFTLRPSSPSPSN
jgi:hypothetical protein